MPDESTASLSDLVMHCKPGLMSTFHRHNDIEINYLEAGSMTYLFSRGRRHVPQGCFVVFWAMFPHRVVDVEKDTLFYCFHLPLGKFLQWRLPPEFVGEVLHGNIVVDETPAMAAVDQAQFPLWYDELVGHDVERRETAFLDIEARLRRVGLSMRASASATTSVSMTPTSTDKLGSMTAFIAEQYTDEVTPSDVADHVGLHPKYAMTLFRKAFDMTVVEYITQLRISHAQRLLATTDLKIVDLAMEAGFGSVSQFYDAFTRGCRCTPSQFRQGIRQGYSRT